MSTKQDDPFSGRNTIRARFAADLLQGEGFEIGAGPWPQVLPPGATCSYFDMRTREQLDEYFGREAVRVAPIADLPARFSQSADFMIAHNVLEHSPDPIGTLMIWHRAIRTGGLVVISLPHYIFCEPDRMRVRQDINHIIEDFLAHADGADPASRAHVADFYLGWWQDTTKSYGLKSIEEFANLGLSTLRSESVDVHWHTYDASLTLEVIQVAAMFAGDRVEILRVWTPDRGETVGDVLVAYKIVERDSEPGSLAASTIESHNAWATARKNLVEGVRRQIGAHRPDFDRDGIFIKILPKPFRLENGHCYLADLDEEIMGLLARGGRLELLENDRPLGPAESLHDDIRASGGGRYSVWGRAIYFSASDSSDPRSNGRMYTVVVKRNVLPADGRA